MNEKKVAIIATGMQAIQFLAANKDKINDFKFILVIGNWSKSILSDFNIINIKGFDKHGRFDVKKLHELRNQLSNIRENWLEFTELWRPDTFNPVTEYLTNIGNFSSIILIEDGLSSFKKEKTISLKLKIILKRIIFRFLIGKKIPVLKCENLSRLVIEDISFNIPKKNDIFINKNDYLNTLKSISNTNYEQQPELLLLTQPLSELGLISLQDELEMEVRFIKIIKELYPDINSIAIKSHPSENETFIEKRKYILIQHGFHLVEIKKELPAEVYLIALEQPPKIVASYYSSALFNIKQIFPSLECVAFITHHFRAQLGEEIIDSFKKSSIKIINY